MVNNCVKSLKSRIIWSRDKLQIAMLLFNCKYCLHEEMWQLQLNGQHTDDIFTFSNGWKNGI